MGLFETIAVYVAALVLLIFSGMPIAFGLGILAVGSLFLTFGTDMAMSLAFIAWGSLANFIIVSIPLFVFMGYLLFETGLSKLIYAGIYPLLDRMLPGGLLHSNIVIGAAFAACSGSSLASCATIGSVALPEMEMRGYDRKVAVGSVAAGSTLGILIPPSITLIIFGIMTEVSIGKLFLGGIIPGLVLVAAYMTYIALRIKIDPNLIRKESEAARKPTWGEAIASLIKIWPVIILIMGVLGSIYTGIATPTEAAAIGCALVLLLAVMHGLMNWAAIERAIKKTIGTSSMILLVYLSGKLMQIYLSNAGIIRDLSTSVIEMGLPALATMAGVLIMYLILGMLMDGLSMTVMTLPITFPIVMALGFDPVWFGVIQTMLIEVGLLTPPVGVNLFVLQGLRPDLPFNEIVRGCAPFFFVLLAVIVLMVIFPQLITFLPAILMP
jgi:C4-dicarboxylate transporter, DctM subunit